MNYLLFIYNYLLFINSYADGQAGRRGIYVRCQYNNVNLDYREVPYSDSVYMILYRAKFLGQTLRFQGL